MNFLNNVTGLTGNIVKTTANLTGNAVKNVAEDFADDPMKGVQTAMNVANPYMRHVKWLKNNLYQILMAYASGYSSIYSMGIRTFLYIFIGFAIASPLIYTQTDDWKDDKGQPIEQKQKMIMSGVFGFALSALLIGGPLSIIREHRMFTTFINESLMFTRLLLFAICMAPGIYFFMQSQKLMHLVFGTGAAVVLYLVLGGFIIGFMRNSKEIAVITVLEGLFAVCPSSKSPCNHQFAGLMPVLDRSIPDFIENAIESIGWNGMLKMFKATEYFEQFGLVM